MQRPILLVAVALASGVAGTFAWAQGSSAQTAAAPPVLDACSPGKAEIVAAALPDPAQAEPGRKVFDLERCPVGERIIRDTGVGSVLPAPGQGVHAEAMTTAGAEVLQIKHLTDGTVVLDDVGSDVEGATIPTPIAWRRVPASARTRPTSRRVGACTPTRTGFSTGPPPQPS